MYCKPHDFMFVHFLSIQHFSCGHVQTKEELSFKSVEGIYIYIINIRMNNTVASSILNICRPTHITINIALEKLKIIGRRRVRSKRILILTT